MKTATLWKMKTNLAGGYANKGHDFWSARRRREAPLPWNHFAVCSESSWRHTMGNWQERIWWTHGHKKRNPLLVPMGFHIVSTCVLEGWPLTSNAKHTSTWLRVARFRRSLPRAELYIDNDGRIVRSPEALRPLTLCSCDCKILTSAICRGLRWYSMRCIHPSQRCISSRQMTDNIFDFETTALAHVACAPQESCVGLTDFAASYPSVNHSWIFNVLEKAELLSRRIYCDSTAHVELAGMTRGQFLVARDVRQGCSASGFLFAMAFDPIFRWLQDAIIPQYPGAYFFQPVPCAHADDFAVAASSFQRLMTALTLAFTVVDQTAGFNFNRRKCCLLQYGSESCQSLLDWVAMNCEKFRDLKIVKYAKYDGTMIGHEGEDDQSPQDGRQRQRSRSRDRVHPHAQTPQTPQEPQIQPMVIQDLLLNRMRILTALGDKKGPDRVSEHLHTDLHMLMMSQQPRTTESREWPFKVQKGKKTVAEVKKPSDLPKAKKHKPMDSDEDDEELLRTLSFQFLCYLSNQMPEEEIQWVDRSNQLLVHKDHRPVPSLRMNPLTTMTNKKMSVT